MPTFTVRLLNFSMSSLLAAYNDKKKQPEEYFDLIQEITQTRGNTKEGQQQTMHITSMAADKSSVASALFERLQQSFSMKSILLSNF